MALNSDLVIKINGDIGNFKRSLSDIQRETKELEQTLSGIAKTSGIAFLALGGIIGANVKQFADFDNQLRSVRTLLDENSFGAKNLEDGFNDLKKSALDLANEVPVNIDSINKALFDTVSAGVEAGKAIDVVRTASRLAVAGLTDVKIATDGITSALNAYGLNADQANNVAAKFFTAQKRGKTTIEELASGFGQVAATAANVGVSLNEVLAAVSAATTGGIKTAQAYTALRAVLANIVKPTEEARQEAERLGIAFDLQAVKAQGLSGFLNSITSASGFTQESLTKLFGSVEGLTAIFSITGQQAESFQQILLELGQEQQTLATLNEAYEVQSASLTNQFKLLGNQFKTAAIIIGSQLAPVVQSIVQAFSGFLSLLSDNPAFATATAAILGITTALAGLVAVLALAGSAYLKINALNLAFAKLTIASTIATKAAAVATGAYTAVVAALGVAFKALLGPIGAILTVVTALGLYFKDDLIVAFNIFKQDAILIIDTIAEGFSIGFSRAKAVAVASLNAIGAALVSLGSLAVEALGGLGGLLVGIFSGNIDLIKDSLNKIGNASIGIFEQTGQKAAEAFKKSYDESIAQYDAEAAAQERIEKEEAAAEAQAQAQADREQARLDRIKEFNAQELEEKKVLYQRLLEEDANYQALSAEQKLIFEEENREALLEKIETEKELEINAANETLQAKIKAEQEYVKNKKKFGKQYADLVKFFNKQELDDVKAKSQQFLQLQRSENESVKAIGKAAALTQIAIDTPRGALSAYSALAPIPFVGPALGAAAAAAVIAYGAEQAGRVLAANAGGMVPINMGQAGVDSVPAMLTPGELVTPRENFDEVVNSVADRRNLERGEDTGGGTTRIELSLRDELVEFVEARLIERGRLNTSLGLV